MLGDPGIGFSVVEEAASFAPGAQATGREIEIVGPFGHTADDLDGTEKLRVAPRREEGAGIEEWR